MPIFFAEKMLFLGVFFKSMTFAHSMSYIFGMLWHLAIIWAIRKAFQCILQGVRFLLAIHTLLSGTSENESYQGDCVGWARDCHYASFHFLCFNQLQLTLENNIYPLHKMISALMTMTKKRPSPIVCHLDKHSQWGPCSWRKKNPPM